MYSTFLFPVGSEDGAQIPVLLQQALDQLGHAQTILCGDQRITCGSLLFLGSRDRTQVIRLGSVRSAIRLALNSHTYLPTSASWVLKYGVYYRMRSIFNDNL